MMTKQNGHAPVELTNLDRIERHAEAAAKRLAEHTADMRAMLVVEETISEGLKAKLDESKARAQSLRRAIADLDPGERVETKTTPKNRNNHDWTVSDAKVEQVMAALVKHGEPVTATSLANKIPGTSNEAVRRAFTVLRERDRIRIAGAGRGGGKLYAPMPDELKG